MFIRKLIRKTINLLPIRLRCLIISIFLKNKHIQIGSNSFIHNSVHMLGRDNIRVGSNTCISEGCWLNVNHKKDREVAIEIGNNCFIGKQNFFTSGNIIQINDYTLTTIGCKFIGSTHKISNPEIPYLLSGTTSEDQIFIGVNCFIGAGVTILGNVKVGHGSVIGAESFVLNDIPPFSIAVGNPAKVVKRYSFARNTWVLPTEMQVEDELSMPSENNYLLQLIAKYPYPELPWMAAGKSMGDL